MIRGAGALSLALLAASACGRPRPSPLAATVDPLSGEPNPRCLESWAESRYRAGRFDHIVHILSSCRVTALCAVSEEGSPEQTDAVVRPGEHVEVRLTEGSPSRDFTPVVSCRLLAPVGARSRASSSLASAR